MNEDINGDNINNVNSDLGDLNGEASGLDSTNINTLNNYLIKLNDLLTPNNPNITNNNNSSSTIQIDISNTNTPTCIAPTTDTNTDTASTSPTSTLPNNGNDSTTASSDSNSVDNNNAPASTITVIDYDFGNLNIEAQLLEPSLWDIANPLSKAP